MCKLGDNITFAKSLSIIVGLYLLSGFIYSFVTPPFEASDEYKHYPVVHHIQNGHGLVVLDADAPGKWRQDGAQPPLYYLLMAAVTSMIDTSDLDDVHIFNEHAFIGDPNQTLNKNLMIPTPHYASFPGIGSTRALYIIRLSSVVVGMGTVVYAGLLGRALFGTSVGLLSALLTALNPMFLFTSAAVNNDSLANLLGAMGLYSLVRCWQHKGKVTYRFLFGFGLILGLGMLTKLSLGALLGLTGIVMMLLAWQEKRWKTLFVDGVFIAIIAFAMASPFFWFNWIHHGDITALNVFIDVQGVRSSPLTWTQFKGEIGTFYRSFWGLFGGVNIAMPQLIYSGLNSLAIIGIGKFLLKGLYTRGAWLVLVWPLILFGLLIRWTLTYPAFQGRLIFPSLTAINVMIAFGMWSFVVKIKRKEWLTIALFLIVVGLTMLAWCVGWFVIRPVYREPSALSNLPDKVQFEPIIFGDAIALVGVDMQPNQEVSPGGSKPIDLTLYWRSDQRVTVDYLTTVHLLGRDLHSVAQVNRHPAHGMIPTNRWQPGQIWEDHYRLFVDENAVSPNQLLVNVGLYNPDTNSPLIGKDVNGNEIELLIVGKGVLRNQTQEIIIPKNVIDKAFEGVTLVGYEMPDAVAKNRSLPITLTWQVDDALHRHYTVFVQLLGDNDNVLASGDSPPLQTNNMADNFPTQLWRMGDRIIGHHMINIPSQLLSGQYRIAVGLYDQMYRLPLKKGGNMVIWPIDITD